MKYCIRFGNGFLVEVAGDTIEKAIKSADETAYNDNYFGSLELIVISSDEIVATKENSSYEWDLNHE